MLKKSESIQNLTKAMAEFQKAVKQPVKNADNPYFGSKYVPLESLVKAVMETGSPLGISFMQYTQVNENGDLGLCTVVMHSSGEYMEFPPLPIRPENNRPQATGSAITYARRYSLSSIFGIASEEDDDGNEASGLTRQVEQQVKQPTKQQQKQQPKAQQMKLNDATKLIEEYWVKFEKIGVNVGEVKQFICKRYNVSKIADIPISTLLQSLQAVYDAKSKRKDAEIHQEEQTKEDEIKGEEKPW